MVNSYHGSFQGLVPTTGEKLECDHDYKFYCPKCVYNHVTFVSPNKIGIFVRPSFNDVTVFNKFTHIEYVFPDTEDFLSPIAVKSLNGFSNYSASAAAKQVYKTLKKINKKNMDQIGFFPARDYSIFKDGKRNKDGSFPEWKILYRGKLPLGYHHCCCCDNATDERYSNLNNYNRIEYYCGECFHTYFYKCPICGEHEKYSHVTPVILADKTGFISRQFICRKCFKKHIFKKELLKYCYGLVDDVNSTLIEGLKDRLQDFKQNNKEKNKKFFFKKASESISKPSDAVINPYHRSSRSKPVFFTKYNFYGKEINTVTDVPVFPEGVYLGLELEVDTFRLKGYKDQTLAIKEVYKTICESSTIDNTSDNRLDDRKLYFMHFEKDGSLNNGFEIITQPTSLGYYQEFFKETFGKIKSSLLKYNLRSNSVPTCGMHIHISKAFFNRKKHLAFYKMCIVLHKFKEEVFKFSRRRRDTPFCCYYDTPVFYSNISSKRYMKAVNREGKGRYGVLNERATTMELRMFRGSLDLNTIISALEFTHGLSFLGKYSSVRVLQECKTFEDVIVEMYRNDKFLNRDGYLLNKLLSMNLISKKVKDEISSENFKVKDCRKERI